jgi:hypothetical protein
MPLKDGAIAQAKQIVSTAPAVWESAAQEVFDEMPSEVVWDEEMLSDMTVHVGLLQQLALGKDGLLQQLSSGKDGLLQQISMGLLQQLACQIIRK